jgi:predicted phage terminase large subunit-like protein
VKELLELLPQDKLKELHDLLAAHSRASSREVASASFLTFARTVYDGFIVGKHHRIIGEAFERVANGELKRVIINLPPRHTKSVLSSYLLPAWLLGRNPKLQVIQANHNAELATRFGRMVRDLVDTPTYRHIFPGTVLREDSKSAGRWLTDKGGEYFAAGVGSAITGRGADVLIIDDPHTEQDALSSTAFDNTYEWYTSGPRQRLQPGAAIVLLMTRWGLRDLTGRLLRASRDPKADQWEVISLPAVLPSGLPLWPEFWDIKSLQGVKASLPGHKWAAQWQQNPTSDESVIIKRAWWRNWPKKDIPNLKFILQSYDTAMSSKETANYSAITTWGIFEPEERGGDQIILLDAVKGRWDFPELKRQAIRQHKSWKPDMSLIEAKASGTPLASELILAGIPVATYAPGRGRDKITRMNLVAPLFEAGRVWAPLDEAFAKAVVDEVSSFPAGEFDDFCDTVSLALHRFRQGGLVSLPSDANDPDAEEEAAERRRRHRRGQEYY